MLKDKFILSIIGVTILMIAGVIFYFSKNDFSSTKDSNDPTPVAEEKQELLKVMEDDHFKGNKDAPVTLIEYLDFECESCLAYYPLIKQLSEEFKNEVRVVNRYFPLLGHKNALPAALAVEAAAKQGKYLEMHDILFENQGIWGGKQSADPKIFEEYAKKTGLDMEQYKTDVDSKEVKERVNRDKISGNQLGVSGTPSFFLNGEKIPNPKTIEDFRTFIKAAILKSPAPTSEPLGEEVHEHADFKVFLSGKAFDFSQAKYQSSETNSLDEDAHLHDGVGNIAHKHRRGLTVGDYFESFGMTFNESCFTTDDGKKYCNDEKNSLKFLVNGKQNEAFENYEFGDLDKLLISYGSKDEDLTNQISSMSDDACIYSEKCPERGEAPTENCVGGLGSDCN